MERPEIHEPLTLREKIGAAIALLSPLLGMMAIGILFAGCVYKGAKVTEGTDLAIGLNVPMSDGVVQLQVLNYLSGFRLGVDRNAILKCEYSVCESNSYLGVVKTGVTKKMKATVEPCEISPVVTNAADSVSAPSAATPTTNGG